MMWDREAIKTFIISEIQNWSPRTVDAITEDMEITVTEDMRRQSDLQFLGDDFSYLILKWEKTIGVKVPMEIWESMSPITVGQIIDLFMIYKPVGKYTVTFLRELGYSKNEISSWTNKTRLLKDLGWQVERAEKAFQTLRDRYGVDISGFESKKHFPAKPSEDADKLYRYRFLRFIPWFKERAKKDLDKIYSRYQDITLEMIEEMIKQKKWIAPNSTS